MMLMRDTIQERGRTLEDEYFRRQEQELLAKAREQNAHATARQRLADATGNHDAVWLDELHVLGYTPDTAVLLPVVPLVEMAWAEGRVSSREEAVIFALAEARGVTPLHPAYEKLERWLMERPPEQFFTRSLRLLVRHFETLPQPERARQTRQLLDECEQVAQASGSPGFLGNWLNKVCAEERALLERLRAELGNFYVAASA